MHFSFRKPHFWHPDSFTETLFSQIQTICVFKHAQKHDKNGGNQWKKLGPVFNTTLGPVFNAKKKSWTSFKLNYIYYIYMRWRPPAGPLDNFPESQFRDHKNEKKTLLSAERSLLSDGRGPPDSQLEGHRASLKLRHECGPWTGSLVGPEPAFKLVIVDSFLLLPSFCLKPLFF